MLNCAKGRFTPLLKQIPDCNAFLRLDLAVKVNKFPPQQLRKRQPGRGFAAAHESREHDDGVRRLSVSVFGGRTHCRRGVPASPGTHRRQWVRPPNTETERRRTPSSCSLDSWAAAKPRQGWRLRSCWGGNLLTLTARSRCRKALPSGICLSSGVKRPFAQLSTKPCAPDLHAVSALLWWRSEGARSFSLRTQS